MKPLRELVAGVMDRFRGGRCVMLGCERRPQGKAPMCGEHEAAHKARLRAYIDGLEQRRRKSEGRA